MLRFEVECETTMGQRVAVCGAGPLGDWDLTRCLLLRASNYPIWFGEVSAGLQPLEFKYVLVGVDDATGERSLVRWESDGPNRQIPCAPSMSTSSSPGTVKRIFHHHFGDPARSSVEVVLEGDPPPAPAFASTAMPPPLSPPLATAAAGPSRASEGPPPAAPPQEPPEGGEEQRSLLENLDVKPDVRFTRLRRATSMAAFDEKYEMHERMILGTGMSGGVCTAKVRETGLEVAVKTLRTDALEPRQAEQVLAEVQNQLVMDHPNICRLMEVFEMPGLLRLVMERMRGPDLYEHLMGKGRYFERDAAVFVRQMASAVAYCHRHGVCHRDLKLENFCLEAASEDARLKMIDFGLSEAFTESAPMTHACGTLLYVAPEVLRQHYDAKCDMWSLGVITYILLDGRAPFHGRDDRMTYRLIIKAQYSFPAERWAHISADAKDFIRALLQPAAGQRLGAEAALAHRWLEVQAQETPPNEQRPLDAQVLHGMRVFSKSNALKRAVLSAVAPVATVEEVGRWADAFEALDEDKTGTVAVQDLAQRLVELAHTPQAEAAALSAALATVDREEVVSYSAFLAACLSANLTMGDQQMRQIFARLDGDADGKVSAADVSQALGNVVDMDSLAEELDGRMLSYTDFRWLMTMPGVGPSILGLRQLLGACHSLSSSWKGATRKAKAAKAASAEDEGEGAEASRRENMAWRLMHHRLLKGGTVDTEPPVSQPRTVELALAIDHYLSATGVGFEQLQAMSVEEKRARAIAELAGEGVPREELQAMELADLAPTAATAEGDVTRTRTFDLITEVQNKDTLSTWTVATSEAKEGNVEAARRENMAWRKLHMDRVKEESEPSGPSEASPAHDARDGAREPPA